jgi:hypothetical protein
MLRMGGILVFNQVINGFIVHTQCRKKSSPTCFEASAMTAG